jgi:hypothetical protein
LFEADAKRCPACHSKLRKRSRPTVLVETAGLADRPLPLVERELQARIEAETAARFRQRRRAAKVARRIAALPATALAGDLVLIPEETEPEPPIAESHREPPTIIDLPDEAVHDVTSTADGAAVPAEPVVEPVVVEPVVAEPVVEPVVAAEPVEAPAVRARKPRRRATKAARIEGLLDDVTRPAPGFAQQERFELDVELRQQRLAPRASRREVKHRCAHPLGLLVSRDDKGDRREG